MTSSTGSAGNIALVTGAAVRIGKAIAHDLADHGWAVAIHYNTSAVDAEATAAEVRAAGHTAVTVNADLTDLNAVPGLMADVVEALGPPNLLVNNASQFVEDRIGNLTPKTWRRQLDVNLAAPILLAQEFAARLPPGRQGNIINILDQRVWKPTPQFFSYSLSKSALWDATQTLAQALAPAIRVNAIGPGPTLASYRQAEENFQRQVAATPLGRGPELTEIATAIRFLVNSPSVTGQMIATDGGQHLAWRTPDVADGVE